MPAFNPAQLAAWTAGRWTAAPARAPAGFSTDTRTLRPGEIFVALRTPKRDGHGFLPAALAAGASAAIVARASAPPALPQLVVADPLAAFQAVARGHRRAFPGAVVAVSGSAGKTSTKDLLALLLGGAPAVLATGGNLNNHIGVPLTLTRLDPAAHTHAVIEAGISAPGEMETLASMIEPDHGIITLVAPAHTGELGNLENVAREKSVLLRRVRPGGARIFPASCLGHPAFAGLDGGTVVEEIPSGRSGRPGNPEIPNPEIPNPKKIPNPENSKSQGGGIDAAGAGVCFYSAAFTDGGTGLALGGGRRFTFRRVTRGMAQNAALAVILAARLGVSDARIQAALAAWRPAKWRGEIRRDARGRLLYLDCYNANPASFADALETFHALAPGRQPRLYVLGCMEELGADAGCHHRALGAALKLRARDELFITGGHAGAVAEAAVEAGADASRITLFDTPDGAAARVAEFPGPVFVKGSRRHALERVLPGGGKEDAAWAS
ncbi:MAG: UDP-N-acetylmuramoyl-tripeptide--D-alanyl-D-alanine ligase [Opitutaceae bacterium]|jgi:UDP-N-acetylmuramoyl-tripeptide--D-alanyl-D-alanine ligase|nr:UDP-N-acetylmuramoyl-tripeptide--D-alanyl-D-alanine ligase [Opitutaceae bacterium]